MNENNQQQAGLRARMKVSLAVFVAFFQACCLLSSPSSITTANAFSSIAYPTAEVSAPPRDAHKVTSASNTPSKLPWKKDGYQTWDWGGHNINYIEMGDSSKPALLLIHGFGASAYHFRYNIPALAKDYHVFAFDILGFGLSDKPLQEYPAEVWKDQTIDFMAQVIQKPVTLAGNSLGGFTALYAAAESCVKVKSSEPMVNACILMNSAGSFRLDQKESRGKFEPPQWLQKLQATAQRFIINAAFVYTKQPARIEQVLKQVYPSNSDMVDADLVESIQFPSLHPNAAEVFYQVISQASVRTTYVDDLLHDVRCPILLCWGKNDPWIRLSAADKIQQVKPDVQRVMIDAGHCPHDEAPEAVNAAISNFLQTHVHGKLNALHKQ